MIKTANRRREDREDVAYEPRDSMKGCRVLHVVSSGRRRGAEVFASDLVGALQRESLEQRVAVLQASAPVAVPFGAPVTVVGRDASHEALRFRTIHGLRTLIRDWHPHIVQAHGGEALKYSFLADGKGHHGIVYRRIGSAHPRTTFGLRKRTYGAMMRRVARVVALSEQVREETIRDFSVHPNRIVTIPNAVDPARLRSRRDRDAMRLTLGVPLDALVVLSLGAFTWEKDPVAQVQIAARVSKEFQRIVFLLAGDGPMRGEVVRAIDRAGLGRSVLLLGSRSDAADLLTSSDVLLLTSRTEGMPGVAIEAGMTGVPVVAYAVGGTSEAVQDGVTGYLAPPGNRHLLTTRLSELLKAKTVREAMGRAAIGWSRSRFDIRVIAPRYLRLYDEVLGGRSYGGSRGDGR
jgi:glycosyltransferase involved in cell wall biosynthesis